MADNNKYDLSNFSDEIFDKNKPLVNDKIEEGRGKGAPLIGIALKEEYFLDEDAYNRDGSLQGRRAGFFFDYLFSGFKNLQGIHGITQVTNETQYGGTPHLVFLEKDFEKLQKPALANVVKSIETLVKNFIPFTKIDYEMSELIADFPILNKVSNGYFSQGINVDAQGNVNLALNESAKKIDFDSINKRLGANITLQKLSVNNEKYDVLQMPLEELHDIWKAYSDGKWYEFRDELQNNYFSEKLKELKLGKGEIECENVVNGANFHIPLDDKYNPYKSFGNKKKYANISSDKLVGESENVLSRKFKEIGEAAAADEIEFEYSAKGVSIHSSSRDFLEGFLNENPDLKILSDVLKSMDKECHKALVPDASISHTGAGQVKLSYTVKS